MIIYNNTVLLGRESPHDKCIYLRHVQRSSARAGLILDACCSTAPLRVCESRLADNLAQLETQSSDQQMQQKELMKQILGVALMLLLELRQGQKIFATARGCGNIQLAGLK